MVKPPVDTGIIKVRFFVELPNKKVLLSTFLSGYIGIVAQLVEQRTLNPLVEGSNPSDPTNI